MGNLLSLKDGTVENITEPKDFADLVEDRFGYDAAQYMKCNFYADEEDPIRSLENVYWSLGDIENRIQFKKMESIETLKLITSLRSKIGRQLNDYLLKY